MAVAGRWARLRFSIVGQLLMAPPPRGGLKPATEALSGQEWQHPMRGERVRFGASTIERWYFAAQEAEQDPMSALARRRRRDAGLQRTISPALSVPVDAQYKAHPSWLKPFHYDNLAAQVEADPDLGPLPSYPTLVRFMHSRGLVRQPRQRVGWRKAPLRLPQRVEFRSRRPSVQRSGCTEDNSGKKDARNQGRFLRARLSQAPSETNSQPEEQNRQRRKRGGNPSCP